MTKILLAIGLILSVVSKLFQLFSTSIIGDILILVAAPFLVLAIAVSIPAYKINIIQVDTRAIARKFAILMCLTVSSFQMLTMITFGWRNNLGCLFFIPFILFGYTTAKTYHRLIKD